jgi:thioesterase domain-containing protein
MYEVARQLGEQGKKVTLIFMVDPPSIGHNKAEPYIPRQKLTLRREYNMLGNIGVITYFKNYSRGIGDRFNKQLDSIIIKTYFCLGKLLPANLRWSYIFSVYMSAIKCYQPKLPLVGIEKAIMIHINNREMEDWINIFNGKIKTYVINCNHLQLLDPPHNFTWLKILKQAIKESMGKHP